MAGAPIGLRRPAPVPLIGTGRGGRIDGPCTSSVLLCFGVQIDMSLGKYWNCGS